MVNQNGDGSGPGYKEYSSEDVEINIMMDYLPDWRYQEHRGSYGSYAQVQFYGAVTDGFAPSIIVTVVPSSKGTFEPRTIEAMADEIVTQRAHFKDAEVLARLESTLLGLPAVDMTLAYKQPDQLRSLNFTMVPFKERVVVVQKGERFYTLRYVNPEKSFQEYENDFLHGLATFRVKE